MLLPADMIARHLGLLGITPQTTVVLVPSDKLHDATLVAIALERVGHTRYAILNGGWEQWAAEKRPVDTRLPAITATDYPVQARPTRSPWITGPCCALARKDRRPGRRGQPTSLPARSPTKHAPATSPGPSTGHSLWMCPQTMPWSASSRTANSPERMRSRIPIQRLAGGRKLEPGRRSSQLVLTLAPRHLLGYRQVKMYDGGPGGMGQPAGTSHLQNWPRPNYS